MAAYGEFGLAAVRERGESGLLVGAAGGGVAGVASGLDHGHRDARLGDPCEGERGEGRSDAASLMGRVDSEHVDLPPGRGRDPGGRRRNR